MGVFRVDVGGKRDLTGLGGKFKRERYWRLVVDKSAGPVAEELI